MAFTKANYRVRLFGLPEEHTFAFCTKIYLVMFMRFMITSAAGVSSGSNL